MTPEEGDDEGKRIAEEMQEKAAEAEVKESAETAGEEPEAGPEADRVAALEEELKTTKERVLRVAADFENFRKRSKREQEEARVRGREEVLREILGVFDNLERAIDAAREHAHDEAAKAIVEGVAMVQKQFADGLARFGLEQFSALGKPFDPNYHEAMAQQHSDELPPGYVLQEYQKGYMLGDRLLRAAMVVVSSASSTGKPPAAAADEEESAVSDANQGEEPAAEPSADEEGSA